MMPQKEHPENEIRILQTEGRTVGRTKRQLYALPLDSIKRMSNASSHVLAQAAVVAAYKLLDH